MIHHISLPARDPAVVAEVLAELMGGRAYPFPGPLPGARMAVSGDPHGTMIEVYPEPTVMTPGPGERPVVYATDGTQQPYAAFHALISVPLDRAAVEALGARVGWRTRLFGRGGPNRPPVFHVIEFWVENRILLEVVTADMIEVYTRYMQPQHLDSLGL